MMKNAKNNDTDKTDMNTYWARIIIVAYNSGSDLQICLDSLNKQTFQSFEVNIIDNASTDDAIDELILPNERYKILKLDENTGFSGGSNRGAIDAKTEWVITLNPDSWPTASWLEELHQTSQIYTQYSMLSSTIVQADNQGLIDSFGDFYSIVGVARNGGRDKALSNRPRFYCETFSPSGAAAAYRTDVFHQANGYDEALFCYLEDVDLGYRLRLMGEACLQCPKAIVKHIGSSSVGKHSDFKYYHSYKNNVRLVLKNTPLPACPIVIPVFLLSQLWWLFRNRANIGQKARWRGFIEGLITSKASLNSRKDIQISRKISTLTLLRSFSWSIKELQRSDFVYRDLEHIKNRLE